MKMAPFYYRPTRLGYRRPATVFRAKQAKNELALSVPIESPDKDAASLPARRWAIAA